jgi:hypothetical protein
MATREEILAGLELAISQGKRCTSLFAPEDWDVETPAGWTPKQMYSHLASTAAIVPQLAAALQSAGDDEDISQGMDLDQMNAQAVSAMAAMTPQQIVAAFETNHRQLIEFVKALPEDQLTAKRRFMSGAVPASDILANAIMLHALHHVYEANTRIGGAV